MSNQKNKTQNGKVRLAVTNDEIQACFPVMFELRPHLVPETFVARVRQMQERMGYQLAYITENRDTRTISSREKDEQDHSSNFGVIAVAGFRVSENFAAGKYLYVEDLVTHPNYRSQGYGAQLLDWLKIHGKEQHACAHLCLDSGLQRTEAHRFYEGQHVPRVGFHFTTSLE